MELFALARQKAGDEMRSEMHWRNAWIPFAFGFARAESLGAKGDADELAVIACAMAPLDARRADEMARVIPGDNYSGWSIGARRRIAHFLVADEPTRRGFVLGRVGSREVWDAGAVQW